MYTAYFGFREQPFSITPDPRFYYVNPAYQEAYAALLYGIRERKGFIVLTGEVGTGKTTLLRRLVQNIEPTIHVAFFYNTTLSFDELLDFACEDFELPVIKGGRSLEKIQALNEFLLTCLKEGGTGVLLIDEAQNLEDDVLENLRLLSNLETDSEKLLQIVLVGQPELKQKLAQPQLRQIKQRVAIQCQLDCLKEREVEPFIEYRLCMVGYEDQGLFPPEAIQRIAAYSKGIPRLINIICDNALLIAYGTAQKTVSASIIEEVAHDLQLEASSSFPPPTQEQQGLRAEAQVVSVATPTTERRAESNQSAQGEPVAAIDWPISNRPRRFLRVGLGTVLILLLLGSTGAAIYPEHATYQLSNLGSQIEDWLGIARQYLTSVSRSLPTRPVSLPAPESPSPSQGKGRSEGFEKPSSKDPSYTIPVVEPKSEILSADPGEKESPSPVQAEGKGEGLEVRSLDQQASTPQPSLPDNSWREHPRVIQPGITLSEMVLETYGSYNVLALDLIKEFNPQVENLDRVAAGEQILFPPLVRETLLREQPDGSFRLILAAFPHSSEAEKFARSARWKGYTAVIIPRKVADSLDIYRVEIGGLKDREAANQAWELVNVRYGLSSSVADGSARP